MTLLLAGLIVIGCGDDDGRTGGTADSGSDSSIPDADLPDATPDGTTPDAAVDASADASAASVRISNTPEDCRSNLVGPFLPDEGGHYNASVITPDAYPFTITEIGYGLAVGEQCVSNLAHNVLVFVHADEALSNEPSGLDSYQLISVEASEDAEERTLTHTLETPIVLEEGQSIVVAVQLATDTDEGTTSLCTLACNGTTEGADWWSNAAQEPFDWADLVADFAFTTNNNIWAVGQAN